MWQTDRDASAGERSENGVDVLPGGVAAGEEDDVAVRDGPRREQPGQRGEGLSHGDVLTVCGLEAEGSEDRVEAQVRAPPRPAGAAGQPDGDCGKAWGFDVDELG